MIASLVGAPCTGDNVVAGPLFGAWGMLTYPFSLAQPICLRPTWSELASPSSRRSLLQAEQEPSCWDRFSGNRFAFRWRSGTGGKWIREPDICSFIAPYARNRLLLGPRLIMVDLKTSSDHGNQF